MSVGMNAVFSVVEWLIGDIPGGLGRRIRYAYWKRRLRSLGRGSVIDEGVRILGPEWVTIGERVWIDARVTILAGPPADIGGPMLRKPNPGFSHGEGEVVVGNNTHVAIGVVLQGHGGIHIGSDTTVASGCLVYSMSHHHSNSSDASDRTVYKFSSMADPEAQSFIISPVVLDDDTALGLNSVALPGTWIRARSWVGVNSTVSGEIPEDSIATGNPAQVVKRRFE